MQKGYLKLSQKNLRARQINGQYIFGNTFLDNLFAPEKKFKSMMDEQVESEQAMMMAPGLALQHFQGWESRGKQILRTVFTQPKLLPSVLSLTSKERIGIETAIKMLAYDGPDPFVDWANFTKAQDRTLRGHPRRHREVTGHQEDRRSDRKGSVRLNKYYIAAHNRKLDAIARDPSRWSREKPRLMVIYDQKRSGSPAQRTTSAHRQRAWTTAQ